MEVIEHFRDDVFRDYKRGIKVIRPRPYIIPLDALEFNLKNKVDISYMSQLYSVFTANPELKKYS